MANVTITGTMLTPDGQPHTGRVVLQATPGVVLDAAGKKVLTGAITVKLDEAGSFSLSVPATDDPALNPTGFTYKLTPRLTAGFAPEVVFTAPATLGTVDYAQIAPVTPSPGVAVSLPVAYDTDGVPYLTI